MIRLLSQILIAGFCVASALAFSNILDIGEFGWLFDLAVQFTPHLALTGILLCAIAVLLRIKRSFLALLTVTTFHIVSMFGVVEIVHPSGTSPNGSASLTIISSNIWHSPDALEKLAELSKTHNADIIAISEMTKSDCLRLAELFPSYTFCEMVTVSPSTGELLSKRMALLSKISPSDFRIYAEPAFRNRAIIKAEFSLGVDKFDLVVLHPVAPGSPAHMRDRDNVLRFASGLVEGKQNFVIAGDMNTTPWARTYRQLPGRRAGDPRLESTWLTKWPLIGLPIDHMLIGQGINLREYETGSHIGSDHRPLIATVSAIAR